MSSSAVRGSLAIAARSARQANWTLVAGGLLALWVIAVAAVGPRLAPQDPLEEHVILQLEDGWQTTPFPVGSPGFWLGSDEVGRDLLSRLLWAVRPTMVMVGTVASVRLVLGLLIGLASGWSRGRLGRTLDAAISGALSVPVLIVALGAIAAVGVEMGLLSFIIALSITGWAETAQIVREQTRLIRDQTYIEAARALGQSDLRILSRHVLRQVMPLAWMLFAFEVSSTLMLTAGLGFLGYYIGGDRWVEVADFVARRLSGMPELGQMLATTQVRFDQPWPVFITGSAVFIIVLSFNLLGEGLRLRLNLERPPRPNVVSIALQRFGAWLGEQAFPSFARWVRANAFLAAGILLLILGIAVGLILWRVRTAAQSAVPAVELTVPGGHLWAAERHDPYGSGWADVAGPAAPQVRWTFGGQGRFSGGPAVAADGTVYMAAMRGALFALGSDGNVRWEAALPAEPVGSPALDATGRIYVTDREGSLAAVSPDGQPVWRFVPPGGGVAVSGPIVAPDGTIYYGLGNSVQAVSSDGAALWNAVVPFRYRVRPPQLDVEGNFVFWEDVAIDARSGTVANLEMPFDVEQYIVGGDGQTYFRVGNSVIRWRWSGSQVETMERTQWDYRQVTLVIASPADAGVTGNGVVWIAYTSWNPMELVWLERDGRMLGVASHASNQGTVLAVDGDDTVYMAVPGDRGSECLALGRGSEGPLWVVPLEGWAIRGGALIDGRLYVVTDDATTGAGYLYALDD